MPPFDDDRPLADLAVKGGNGGGVDDDAALAVVMGSSFCVRSATSRIMLNGADQIDLDHLPVGVERMRAVLAERLDADRDARAVDQDAGLAKLRRHFRDRCLGVFGTRHVASDCNATDFGSNLLGALHAHIQHSHLGTFAGQCPCGRLSQT